MGSFVAAGTLARHAGDGRADAAYFAGKNVVITGGSRGLGFTLATLLLEAGANVMIGGRSRESITAALAAWSAFARSADGVVCDVRDQRDAERLIAAAHERFGPVDVLINNAGIIEVGPFADQTLDDFRAAFDTHLWAPLYTTLAVLPSMRARSSGSIVNVASVGGVVGVPHLAAYCASKFAQVGLTQVLAAELAAEGIAVTSVVPGLMRTGSPGHATFKGRHRAEYAWFTLADSTPLLSVAAPTAARRILRAIRQRETLAVIGSTAQAAKIVNALFPAFTATLLRVAAVLLPRPGGIETAGRRGDQSRSALTESPLTALNRKAMRAANQLPTTSAADAAVPAGESGTTAP
jgi:NAD(P)-dependent dehydrogenase (short-subunit alcohol dehydrogenase family)